jgi:hypothetical protein
MMKTIYHRSRVILNFYDNFHKSSSKWFDLWRKQNVIELFWHAWQGGCHADGCFHWRCFPCVHAIASCIGDGSGVTFLLHNVAISGYCMFQVLTGPRVGFLLFHMLVFYGHTCHVAIGSRVTSSLDHVVVSYLTTCHITVHPRFAFLFGHLAWWHPSTCCIFNSPRVVL